MTLIGVRARLRRVSPAGTALVLLILLYTAGFSILSIRTHEAQQTNMADLGQIDLAIWNTSRGRFVQEIKDDFVSTRLTDHVEPIFAPLSLIFYLWDDVRALLVLQSLALALGALPVYLLARDLLDPTHPSWTAPDTQRAAARAAPTARSSGGSRFTPSPTQPSTTDTAPPTQDPSRFTPPVSRTLLPLVFAVAYLLFPALEAANVTEFHAIPFAVLPVLLALLWAERRQWAGFVAACVILMTVKEEAALLALLLGLYGIWIAARDGAAARARAAARAAPTGVWAGCLVVVFGALWFYVATFVIIPHYAAQVYGIEQSVYFNRFGALGDTPLAIVRSFFTRPLLVWQIATEPMRLRYLFGLLAPVGFLSLLGPEILLLSAPLLIANLFSAFPAQYSGEFHYSAPLVPYIVVAAIYGTRRLLTFHASRVTPTAPAPNPSRRAPTRHVSRLTFHPARAALGSREGSRKGCPYMVALFLLACSLGYQVAAGFTPLGRQFRWDAVTPHDRLLARFAAQVPESAPGSATTGLYPHFSHREKLYKFPIQADASWALVDVTGTTDRHPLDIRRKVLDLLTAGWQVTDAADGYVLLMQPQPAAGSGDAAEQAAAPDCRRTADDAAYAACALPDRFFDFARAARSGLGLAGAAGPTGPGGAIRDTRFSVHGTTLPVSATFGSTLHLSTVTVLDDARWQTTHWAATWQATQPLATDVQIRPFAVAPDGSLVDDPGLRPPVALVWYPPWRWQPGERVIVDTLPWFLPPTWAPALGVYGGDSWENVAQRWAVSGDVPRFDRNTWAQLPALTRRGRELLPWDTAAVARAAAPLPQFGATDGAVWGTLLGAELPAGQLRAGEPLTVTVRWQLAQLSPVDYTVFVHVRSAAGKTIRQADAQPVWFGVRPFGTWQAGEQGLDRHVVELGPDVACATGCTVVVGLYDAATGQRLTRVDAQGRPLGDEVSIGEIGLP